jgi:hypothetical protein
VQPLAISAAATAETTAPAKKIRLIENMLAPPASWLAFVLPFTADHLSKGRASRPFSDNLPNSTVFVVGPDAVAVRRRRRSVRRGGRIV